MYSPSLRDALLSASDVSSILNLICPHCGGPLGRLSEELTCQGECRKDWRPAWENTATSGGRNQTTCRSKRRRMASASK